MKDQYYMGEQLGTQVLGDLLPKDCPKKLIIVLLIFFVCTYRRVYLIYIDISL